MAVGSQDQIGVEIAEPGADGGGGRGDEVFTPLVFEKIGRVVTGPGVHRHDAGRDDTRLRQIVEPRESLPVERRAGVTVGRAEGGGFPGRDPSVVVAADRRPSHPPKKIERLPRPQRSRNAVAQVDHGIHVSLGQVDDDGFERRQIAMNIGENREPHQCTCVPKSSGQSEWKCCTGPWPPPTLSVLLRSKASVR